MIITKDNVLKFYEESDFFEKTSNMSYRKKINSDKLNFNYSKMEDIYLEEGYLIISIDKRLQMFLTLNDRYEKGISPINRIKNKNLTEEESLNINKQINKDMKDEEIREIEDKNLLFIDKNRLLISPIYIKLIFLEENSEFLVPLGFFDITENKKDLNDHDFRKGKFKLKINIKDGKLIFNEFALSILKKESSDSLFHSLEYLSNSNTNGFNTIDLLEKIYSEIEKNIRQDDLIEIVMPNLEKDPALVYFNQNYEQNNLDEYEPLKLSNSELLTDILTSNIKDIEKPIFYGSQTSINKLSKGQFKVLKSDTNILSVFGAPGTGKTNLFSSIIANQITERAISLIFDNKDYNSLILISSTSNKAIENVIENLDNSNNDDIYFMAGNLKNRKKSSEKVLSFISNFEKETFLQENLDDSIDKIKLLKNNIDTYIEEFTKAKSIIEKYNIKSYKIFEGFLNNLFDEKLKKENERILIYVQKIIDDDITPLIGDISLREILDFFNTKDWRRIQKTTKRIENLPLFFDILGARKIILSKLSIDNIKFDFRESDLFIDYSNALDLIFRNKEKYERSLKEEIEIKSKIDLFKLQKINKEIVLDYFKYKTIDEFVRNKLYIENFNLFLLSKRFLKLIALKNKYKTIEALEVLASNDFYNILDKEELLKRISLVYPVITSTIAGFKYLFRNFNKDIYFNKVLFDEAAMIKTSSALEIISKSEKTVIVGDPKQLPPIFNMQKIFNDYLKEKTSSFGRNFFNKYSLTNVSLFHLASQIDSNYFSNKGSAIVLDEHRRCQEDIAKMFLEVSSYEGIHIETKIKDIKNIHPFNSRMVLIDTTDKSSKNYINNSEINAISNIINIFKNSTTIEISKDVCLITPFVNQETELIRLFSKELNHTNENKKIGTVHKFQGSEFKIVIFSSVISSQKDSLSFINNGPYMINVAISRAKELFIMVSDKSKIEEDISSRNYIGRAIKYILNNGLVLNNEDLKKLH